MNLSKLLYGAIVVLLVFGVAFAITQYALAVHDLDLFELDRNATDEGGGGDDWATLYGGGGSADGFSGIIADIAAPGNQFHGGGSKDDLDISRWLWVDGEPLDKDDITNAYAAGYIYEGEESCPEGVPPGDESCTEPGDLIIYFGLDRYANNGSAQVGFWFFQNPVGLTDTPRSGGFEFSGVHTIGDILVQSNFSQGGIIDSISVYQWVGSGGSNGTLDLVYSAQDCATTLPGDLACATVNQGDQTAPWPFTPKFGTAGTFPQGSFFEGGINVSALVPDAGCFSGFLAETRSSTPFDSRLKDFALGSLSLCHIEGTKYLDVNGNGTRDEGEPPLEGWEIQLSGAASLTAYTDADGHYSFDDLGNGSYTVTEVCPVESPAWVQTEPGVYTEDNCGDETYSFDIDLSNTSGIGDFGNGAPEIDVSKTCTAVVEVGQPIDYTFVVSNTGNVNLVNVDVTDILAGFDNDPDITLAPGAYQDYYTQTTTSSAGQIINTVNASGDFGSSTVYASVDASDSCTTYVVDAKITITPDDTNEVGDPHTFTVTVSEDDGSGSGFQPAAGEHVDFTLTDSNGASYTLDADSSTCDDAGPNTDTNGECTIVFSSDSAGQVTGHASSSISVRGLSLFRETDGTGSNSDDAVKTYVDAKITIAPDDTNEVSDPHTFTVTVYEDDGSGSGFQPAAGEHVDYTLTNSNGASYVLDAASSTCDDAGPNTDANGQCTIVFSSDSAGKVTGHASSNVSVGGLFLSRATDGVAPNSGDAVKTYVDAYITISPDDTNEVGDPHTFTVTVYEDDGSESGFQPAAGEHVDFSLTNSNEASYILDTASSTCDDAGPNTNSSGQCTIVFTSNSAGQVTGHAYSYISVGGLSLYRVTDGTSPNSGDAVKTFVDARISITPDGTNGVGEDHTFTVLAEKNEGQGDGWEDADDGTIVLVTLTDSGGANSVVSSETCSTGTASGECSVTFSSDTAGTTVGHAAATILSGGLDLDRETDGQAGNSGDATKYWVAGSLAWLKQDNNGNPLGGATFEVCWTVDRFGNDITDVCNTVLDNQPPDEDSDAGEFLLINLPLGTYTIEETVPPPGYAGDSYVETIVLTLLEPDKMASHIWVNTPNQGCTPGFWQGGAGAVLWDEDDDPDWVYNDTNPFIHTTLFNDFFNTTTDPRLAGYTMFELVSSGGGADWAVKAARDMVAAYLNESAFPDAYPALDLDALKTMWYDAVAGGDAGLQAFHNTVGAWNSPDPGYCPLP